MLDYMSPPFTIKVELTEGCNLYCKWCGIRGIRKTPGNYKFMEYSLAKSIAQQIRHAGWNSRLELTMRGEPTLNPDKNIILKVFRDEMPAMSIMMTSNGGGLLKGNVTKNIDEMFDSGLNMLALDDYGYSGIIPKLLEEYKGDIPIKKYPEDSPYKRRKPSERMIIIIPDIGQYKVGTRGLSNHCGCAFPYNFTKSKSKCARPFRELVIRYDGYVPLCCNDWRGVYSCGNVKYDGIEDLWDNKYFDAMRRHLFLGQRIYAPCFGCDSVSYRVGLLPDKMGKMKNVILEPDKASDAIIKKVLKQGSLNDPVLRKWEIGEVGIKSFIK